MPIQQWSDGILLVDLADPPQFSEEMGALKGRINPDALPHVVLNFSGVTRIGSTNIAQLLELREKLIVADRHLILCSLSDGIWGIMLVSALDKHFEFAPDVPSALASLQLEGDDEKTEA